MNKSWMKKGWRCHATSPEREILRNEFLSLSGDRFERITALKRHFGLSYVFIATVLNEDEKTHARGLWRKG
jgi:hypothetical protein